MEQKQTADTHVYDTKGSYFYFFSINNNVNVVKKVTLYYVIASFSFNHKTITYILLFLGLIQEVK